MAVSPLPPKPSLEMDPSRTKMKSLPVIGRSEIELAAAPTPDTNIDEGDEDAGDLAEQMNDRERHRYVKGMPWFMRYFVSSLLPQNIQRS